MKSRLAVYVFLAIASMVLVHVMAHDVYAQDSVITIPNGTATCTKNMDECYMPNRITVSAGSTIEWKNNDASYHTVTNGIVREGEPGLLFDGQMNIDQTFEHTFSETGEYPYFCTLHPRMAGVVVVTQDGKPVNDIVENENKTNPTERDENNGGGCLIATATYGTEMADQVQMLREIRDNTLLSTSTGVSFMSTFNDIYYTFSPTVADLQRQSPELKSTVQALIAPMMATLSIMSLAEAGSDSDVLGLGMLVIVLNLGLYAGVPILTIFGAHRAFIRNST